MCYVYKRSYFPETTMSWDLLKMKKKLYNNWPKFRWQMIYSEVACVGRMNRLVYVWVQEAGCVGFKQINVENPIFGLHKKLSYITDTNREFIFQLLSKQLMKSRKKFSKPDLKINFKILFFLLFLHIHCICISSFLCWILYDLRTEML